MEHPLGIYVFGDTPATDHVIQNTISGGVTINDALLHAGVPDAPFGGVGESGIGSYHGRYGILAFSHQRTVLALPTWLDRFMDFRYPPYTKEKLEKVEKVKANFKRGESQEDQRIRKVGGWGGLWKVGFVVAVAAVAVADRQGLLKEWLAKLF
jgi:aldehyde dehydrogenase (NAD+)